VNQKLLILFMVLAVSAPARADDESQRPLLDGRAAQHAMGIEVGGIAEGGATEYAAGGLMPSAQGLVLRDRNGMTARYVVGLVIAVASALAQSGPKSVESKSYVQGDYLVTETTTTYYSEAEKAQMRAATNSTIDGLFSAPYSDMELHVFSRDALGVGNASGYHLNFLCGYGETLGLETGFGFGNVDSLVDDAGMKAHVRWKYFGMPFRASLVAGPFRIALAYEWNWLKYGATKDERRLHMNSDGTAEEITAVSHPWHLDVSTILAHRILVSGGVTTQQIQKPALGYFATAGVMF